MTAGEAVELLRWAPPDLPLVVLVDGVWREVEAVYALGDQRYLPVDALVAQGAVVGLRAAE